MRANPRRVQSNAHGVTLLELMIVVAVMSIIAAISGPNLSILINRTRLDGATARLERSITIARRLALADRTRVCLEFEGDSNYANFSDEEYLIYAAVSKETAPSSGIWTAVTATDYGTWTNSPTTALYRGISLETDPSTTTLFGATDDCNGIVFNTTGWLDNPSSEFSTAGGGSNCALLTLRAKNSVTQEKRTLWIDRGGNVRVSAGPNTPPVLDPS